MDKFDEFLVVSNSLASRKHPVRKTKKKKDEKLEIVIVKDPPISDVGSGSTAQGHGVELQQQERRPGEDLRSAYNVALALLFLAACAFLVGYCFRLSAPLIEVGRRLFVLGLFLLFMSLSIKKFSP